MTTKQDLTPIAGIKNYNLKIKNYKLKMSSLVLMP